MEDVFCCLVTDKQARYLSKPDSTAAEMTEPLPLEAYDHEVLEEGINNNVINGNLNLGYTCIYNESDIDAVLEFCGDSFEPELPKKTPKMLDTDVIKQFQMQKRNNAKRKKKEQAAYEKQAKKKAKRASEKAKAVNGKRPYKKRTCSLSVSGDTPSGSISSPYKVTRKSAPAMLQNFQNPPHNLNQSTTLQNINLQYHHYTQASYSGMFPGHYLPPNVQIHSPLRSCYRTPLHHRTSYPSASSMLNSPSLAQLSLPELTIPEIDVDQFFADPPSSSSKTSSPDSQKNETEASNSDSNSNQTKSVNLTDHWPEIVNRILNDPEDKLMDLKFRGDLIDLYCPEVRCNTSYFEVEGKKGPVIKYMSMNTDFIVDLEDLDEPLKEICGDIETGTI